jgi:hypothetical protein
MVFEGDSLKYVVTAHSLIACFPSKSSHVRLAQYRARKQAAHHEVNRLLTRAVLYRVPILCGSI